MYANTRQQWKGFIFFLLFTTQYSFSIGRVVHYHRSTNDELEICPTSIEEGKVCSLEKPQEKRIIVAVLMAVSIFATLANLAFDIYLQVEGCCGIYPDACTYQDKFNSIKDQLKKDADIMNDEYSRLTTTLDYIKQTNQENHNIFQEVTRIMQLEKRVIETLDSEILTNLNFKRDELRDSLDAHNQTVQKWTMYQLSTSWKGVFANAESAAMALGPVIGTLGIQAIQSGMAWYKGYKVAQAVKAQSSMLTASTKANKIMGVSSVKSYTAQTVTAQQKAVAGASTMSKFAKVAGATMAVVSIGFEIYMAIQKVKACKKVRNQCRDAYKEIKDEPKEFEATEAELVKFKNELDKSYDDTKGQMKTEKFLDYLVQIKGIAQGADVQTEELKEASTFITDFHASALSLDGVELITFQKDLYKALVSIEYTWLCFDKKISAVSYVYEHCKKGTNSLQWLFTQASGIYNIDSFNCTNSVGHKYMTYTETENYVYVRMEEEGYIADCVLNNNDLRHLICSDYAQDYSNQEIADGKQLTLNQVKLVINICPPADVSPLVKEIICGMKLRENLEKVVAEFSKYDFDQVVAAYNECPKPRINDEIKFAIDVMKYLGSKLSKVLEEYSQYNDNEIKSYYPKSALTMTWAEKSTVCLAKKYKVPVANIMGDLSHYPESFVKDIYNNQC